MSLEWQEKAEWLRSHGYALQIEALCDIFEEGDNWMASIGGEGRRYAPTIGEAIEQVYEWVSETEIKFD